MTASTTLAVLKYVGFGIGTASTLWGLTRRTTFDDERGQRRLTAAGYLAIALTLCSFLVSAVSYGIETVVRIDAERTQRDRAARQEAQSRVAAAEQRALEAERRADAAFLRASAADQRALTVATATESRRRDLDLARQVNEGTQQNLTRAGLALTQLERLLLPLGAISVSVTWELPGSEPGMPALTKRLADFSTRVWTDTALALGTTGLVPGGMGGRVDSFLIDSSFAYYPSPERERALFEAVRFANMDVSFFAAGGSTASARVQIAEEPVRRRRGIADLGDVRFTVRAGVRPQLTYVVDTGIVRMTVSGKIERISMKRSGEVVSVPDVDRSLVAFSLEDDLVRGEAQALRRAMRPIAVSILLEGDRTYRIPIDRLERVSTFDGATVWLVQPVLRATPAATHLTNKELPCQN